MPRRISLIVWLLMTLLQIPRLVEAQSAQTIMDQAAKAMGGMTALRALRNEIVESEGKQYDSSSTPQPLGPTRQISTFRYSLTRDLTQPRLRLEWDGHTSGRNEAIRFVEVIDANTGSLREGEATAGKISRLHPGRLATRLREERRAPAKLLLTAAAAQRTLRRLADADVGGQRQQVIGFIDNGDEFRFYIDSQTHLPTQADLLEDDPLEGDSSYLLTLRRLA